MKLKYEVPELEVTYFENEDIVTESNSYGVLGLDNDVDFSDLDAD